jgi:hypothetical protein
MNIRKNRRKAKRRLLYISQIIFLLIVVFGQLIYPPYSN